MSCKSCDERRRKMKARVRKVVGATKSRLVKIKKPKPLI